LWLEKRRERSGLLRAIEQDRAVLEREFGWAPRGRAVYVLFGTYIGAVLRSTPPFFFGQTRTT
jgi:hypothetical protein